MTYNEFIVQYPWVDLILKIFSDIAPVVVAILAIVINNKKSSTRDKRNKKIDMIVNYENLLIDKIGKLEAAIDDLLDSFVRVLNSDGSINAIRVFETYDLCKDKVSSCNMELYNLSFCTSEIVKENVNGKDISDDIKQVVGSMDELIHRHLSEHCLNGMCDIEKQEVRKIKDDIIDLKSWLTIDMKRVMEKTYDLLK